MLDMRFANMLTHIACLLGMATDTRPTTTPGSYVALHMRMGALLALQVLAPDGVFLPAHLAPLCSWQTLQLKFQHARDRGVVAVALTPSGMPILRKLCFGSRQESARRGALQPLANAIAQLTRLTMLHAFYQHHDHGLCAALLRRLSGLPWIAHFSKDAICLSPEVDDALAVAAPTLRALHSLDVAEDCETAPRLNGLLPALGALTALTRLSVAACFRLDADVFSRTRMAMPDLRELKLVAPQLTGIVDSGAGAIFSVAVQHLRLLSALHFDVDPAPTERVVAMNLSLATRLARLALKLRMHKGAACRSLESGLARCTRLTELRLMCEGHIDAAVAGLVAGVAGVT